MQHARTHTETTVHSSTKFVCLTQSFRAFLSLLAFLSVFLVCLRSFVHFLFVPFRSFFLAIHTYKDFSLRIELKMTLVQRRDGTKYFKTFFLLSRFYVELNGELDSWSWSWSWSSVLLRPLLARKPPDLEEHLVREQLGAQEADLFRGRAPPLLEWQALGAEELAHPGSGDLTLFHWYRHRRRHCGISAGTVGWR